jgi:hypothetical protein
VISQKSLIIAGEKKQIEKTKFLLVQKISQNTKN